MCDLHAFTKAWLCSTPACFSDVLHPSGSSCVTSLVKQTFPGLPSCAPPAYFVKSCNTVVFNWGASLGDIWGFHNLGVLLESTGQRPGILLNILQCTEPLPQPQTTKNYLAQNVHSAKVENSHTEHFATVTC